MSLPATTTATTTQKSSSTSEEKSSLQDSSSDIFTRIFLDLPPFFQACEVEVKKDALKADISHDYQCVLDSFVQLREDLNKLCDQKLQGLDEKSKQTSLWTQFKQTLTEYEDRLPSPENSHKQKGDSSSSQASSSSSASSSSLSSSVLPPSSASSSPSSSSSSSARRSIVSTTREEVQTDLNALLRLVPGLQSLEKPVLDQYQKLFHDFWDKTQDLLVAYRGALNTLTRVEPKDFDVEKQLTIAQKMDSIVPQNAEDFYLDKGIDCLLNENIKKNAINATLGRKIFILLGKLTGCIPNDPLNDDFSPGLTCCVLYCQTLQTSYLDEAITQWKPVAAKGDRQHVLHNFLLGWAYIQYASLEQKPEVQQNALAIPSYEKALRYASKNARYNFDLGRAYFALACSEKNSEDKQRKFRQAIPYLKEAVKYASQNATYNHHLGLTYAKLSLLEEKPEDQQRELLKAIPYLREAVRYDPQNALYNSNLGMTYIALSNLHQAIPYLEKAVELGKAVQSDSQNALYNHNLGSAYYRLSSLEQKPADKQRELLKAIPYLREAVRYDPQNATYNNALGANYIKLSNLEEKPEKKQSTLHQAIPYLEKAVELGKAVQSDSKNALYNYDLGATYTLLSDFEEKPADKQREFLKAIPYLKEAVRYDPQNATYNHDLGIVYFHLSKLEEKPEKKQSTLHQAIPYLEKAVELGKAVQSDPQNATYNYALGMTYLELGKLEKEEKNKQSTLHQAIPPFEKAFELEKAVQPDSKNAIIYKIYNNLGIIHFMLGCSEQKRENKQCEFLKAIPYFKETVRYDPQNATYNYHVGVTYGALSNLEEKPENQQDTFHQAILYLETAVQAAAQSDPNRESYQRALTSARQKLAALQPPSAIASTPSSSSMPLSSSSFSATSSTAMITNSLILPTSLPTSTTGLTSVASLPPAQSSSTSSVPSSSFKISQAPLMITSGSSSNINSAFGLSMSSEMPPLEPAPASESTPALETSSQGNHDSSSSQTTDPLSMFTSVAYYICKQEQEATDGDDPENSSNKRQKTSHPSPP